MTAGCPLMVISNALQRLVSDPKSPFYNEFECTIISINCDLDKLGIEFKEMSENFKEVRIPLHIEEGHSYLKNLSGDILMTGCGEDIFSPCKDAFGFDIERKEIALGWDSIDFIDSVKNNFDFIFALEAGCPVIPPEVADKSYWDRQSPVHSKANNPVKETTKYLLSIADGAILNRPYPLELSKRLKIWDWPIFMIGDDINNLLRFKEQTETIAKCATVNASNNMSSIYQFITESVVQVFSRLCDSSNNNFDLWQYHMRISSSMAFDKMGTSEDFSKALEYLKSCSGQTSMYHHFIFNSFWDVHSASNEFSWADERVYEYINRTFSFGVYPVLDYILEFTFRSTIDFVIAGLPVIAPGWYYQNILYPELCISNNEEMFELLDQPYNFFKDHVNNAQDILRKWNLDSNVEEFYQYFIDFMRTS